jgi:hypothetical protein
MSSSEAAITNYTKGLLCHFGFQNCVRVEALQDVESGQAFYKTTANLLYLPLLLASGSDDLRFPKAYLLSSIKLLSYDEWAPSCVERNLISEGFTVLRILEILPACGVGYGHWQLQFLLHLCSFYTSFWFLRPRRLGLNWILHLVYNCDLTWAKVWLPPPRSWFKE